MRGSYAGAIGIPQFMPSSTRRYAVDFDGNGAIDLRRSPADAIGSVANFLKEHGWQPGGEVLLGAKVDGRRLAAARRRPVEPKHGQADLRAAGVQFDGACPRACVRFWSSCETPDKPSDYRVGLHNFWVLTRYNRSAFYASRGRDLARQGLKQGLHFGK